MDESFLLKPLYSLGEGVSAFMLNRKFFDKHPQSFRSNEFLHSLVASQVKLPIMWLDQVHSAEVEEVYKAQSEVIAAKDGLYSKRPNLILAVKTADCLPLILSHKDGREISALHVGWRGLYKGIIEKALSFFKCDLKEINAWLAPSISAGNYEVGEDVFYAFLNTDNGSISSFQETEKTGKWLFNLKQESVRRLEQKGVKIFTNNLCTYKDKKLFYSYRRNGNLKRMVTLIWRDDEK